MLTMLTYIICIHKVGLNIATLINVSVIASTHFDTAVSVDKMITVLLSPA